MTPTNVVSMNFKDKASLDDFVKMYQKDSPKLYSDAEILMFIKLKIQVQLLSQFIQMKKQG